LAALRIRRRYAVLGLLALLLLLLIVTGLRGAALVGDLQEGRSRLVHGLGLARTAGMALTSAEAGEIGADLRAADSALSRAERNLRGDPLLAWLRPLPIVGPQLSAVDVMVDGVRAVTRHHESVTELLDGVIAARDGAAGASRLAAIARLAGQHSNDINALATAFRDADNRVSTLSPDGLIGPVETARSSLVEQFVQVRPLVATVETGVRVIPSLMGVGGEKRYLLFALDNAEIRPIGGLIGAFATPRFTDGLLQDLVFKDILAVDRVDQGQYVAPPEALGDHLLNDFTWQVADAGWWPDFADSVRDARRMYEIETGDGNFDGAIAFTPEFVDRLLEIVGPVEIPEAGVTVHPGETHLVSLEQVSVLRRGEGRKQFLAFLASAVLDRIFELPPARYPEVASALDEAAKRRQFQIIVDDPASQEVLTRIGWYRPFTFPDEGDRLSIMEANVAPVSKLNVLIELDHALEVQLQPDGSAQERLVTSFTNKFGPDLSPELERVRLAFGSGNLGSYHRRYLDPEAEVLSVSGGDPEFAITDPDDEDIESGSLAVGNYQFVRPGVVRLETAYLVPNILGSTTRDPATTGTYRLTFRKQPGRDRDSLRVSVTVPQGTIPTAWTDGGIMQGSVVTFSVTTEFDQVFEVTYAAL
jgi:uncharacterized protein DUF4012